MTDQFVGEIRMFAGNFAPVGWATCDGQLLAISQNTALFSLLGTTYGGNGTTNFALPNLQGSAPMHSGQGAGLSNRVQGETGGSNNVTLLQSELPSHNHQASGAAGTGPTSPENAVWGTQAGRTPSPTYSSTTPNVTMGSLALSPSGGGLPHNNMQPYLALTFIIAMVGIFPPRA